MTRDDQKKKSSEKDEGIGSSFHAATLHGDGTGSDRVSVVCRSNDVAVVVAAAFTIDHCGHGSPRLFQPHAVFPDVAAAAASGLPFAHVPPSMYIGMSLDGPTTVRAAPVQRAVLGLYPYGDSSATATAADEANLAALVSILHDVGKLDIRTVSQVQGARWQKCLWNATFGLLGLAAGGVDSQALVEDPSAMVVVRRRAAEVSGAAEFLLG
ncbi:hypothetical protein HK405_008651 [Cladochytrium tenue]|nr:hypothetical protein HK405_008651 [Cladochytrium tenue]